MYVFGIIYLNSTYFLSLVGGGGGEGGYVKFFNEFAKQSKIEIENNIYINVN